MSLFVKGCTARSIIVGTGEHNCGLVLRVGEQHFAGEPTLHGKFRIIANKQIATNLVKKHLHDLKKIKILSFSKLRNSLLDHVGVEHNAELLNREIFHPNNWMVAEPPKKKPKGETKENQASQKMTIDFLKYSIANAKHGVLLSSFSDEFVAKTNEKVNEETARDFPHGYVQVVSMDKGKRNTIIRQPQIMSETEFNDWNVEFQATRPDFDKKPQMASIDWEGKGKYEVGNLTRVSLDDLLNSFLLVGSTIDEIRDELAIYKNDRRGKAMQTPGTGVHVFWQQLWGVFCSIFGAGKWAMAQCTGNPTGIQWPIFVGVTFDFVVFGTTDRYSTSQLEQSNELNGWANAMAEALDPEATEEAKEWVLNNGKGFIQKPNLFYNGTVDDSFKEIISNKIADKILPIFPKANIQLVIELLAKKDWMKCVNDIVSEKYDKGTTW